MTRFTHLGSPERSAAASIWGVRDLRNRPPVATAGAGGSAIYAIEVFENQTPNVTGDGAFEWEIPEDLDQAVLAKVEIYVTTASSSGSVQVQIRNETTGFDMLTSKATVDVGKLNSKDSATPPVVDAAHQTVSWGDHLNVDVDAVGTGSTGLGVVLYFTPLATLALAVRGAKGDPGGVTSWQGAWNSGTTYSAGQAVSNNGSSYVAIGGSTNVQPGVTAGWQTYWMLLAGNQQYTVVTAEISAQGFLVSSGLKAIFDVPFAATIVACRVLADQVGSVVFDIKKCAYSGYPGSLTSIVGASPPTLSAVVKSEDTALSGWTTSVAAGDVFQASITSTPLNVTWLALSLKLQRI